jgi:hypothetical protein
MVSAAQSAANRSNAQESTGPRTSRGKAALRRNPLRHLPAELGSTAPQPPRGRSRENRHIGKAEPIYRMRSASAMSGESRFDAAGSRLRVRTQLVQTR